MATREKHLYYLSELKDYKIKKNDPDIRGWAVKDLDNRVVGKVDNLLVNKELGKVVYVDVEVEQSIIDANHDPYANSADSEIREFINKEGENHIIIPIGLISLNRDSKYVFTESINYRTFAETKRYRSGTDISRDYEHHVLGSYNRRRDRDLTEEELQRTRSAYTDAELEERELRRREEARLADERKQDLAHDDYVREKPSRDADDRIRREKEELRYNSDRERSVSGDYKHGAERRDHLGNLQPEPTYDDDASWEHENKSVPGEDPYRKRNKRNTRVTDEFYDRKEFHERDQR